MQYQGSVIPSNHALNDTYTSSPVVKTNKIPTVNILDVEIDNLSRKELLDCLADRGGVVVTPNVDHLMKLQHDQEFSTFFC